MGKENRVHWEETTMSNFPMTDVLDQIKRAQRFPQLYKSRNTTAQHNDLIQACYEMTLNEKRVLMLGLWKISEHHRENYPYELDFTITATEWAKFFRLKSNAVYSEFKKAIESLRKRGVKLKHTDTSGEVFGWIEKYKYWDKEGTITGTFTRRAAEYLTGLTGNYTQVDLLTIANLQSFYAIRLYELLRQWNSHKEKKLDITVDRLREILCLTDEYPRFSKLRKWVIDPAIEQLTMHTDIKPTLEVFYIGKTAAQLIFTWGNKPPIEIPVLATKGGDLEPLPRKRGKKTQSTRDRSIEEDLTDTSWA